MYIIDIRGETILKVWVNHYTQVLSESVSKALKLTGGPEVVEIAKFVEYMDKFFDALNVSNYSEGIKAEKKFSIVIEDERIEVSFNCFCIFPNYFCVLAVARKDFLPYLYGWEDWAKSIPDLTKTERNNLLLNAETRLGLKMTCKEHFFFVLRV